MDVCTLLSWVSPWGPYSSSELQPSSDQVSSTPPVPDGLRHTAARLWEAWAKICLICWFGTVFKVGRGVKSAWDHGSVDVATLLFAAECGGAMTYRCVWLRNHTVWLRWESMPHHSQLRRGVCVCSDSLRRELIRWFSDAGLGRACLNLCGGGLFGTEALFFTVIYVTTKVLPLFPEA